MCSTSTSVSELLPTAIERSPTSHSLRVKGYALTLEEARAYDLSLSPSDVTADSGPPTEDDQNCVLTFAELKELIETGNVDKIPNNKIIPEGLNVRYRGFVLRESELTLLQDAPPSQSTAPSRKKPWEKSTDQ